MKADENAKAEQTAVAKPNPKQRFRRAGQMINRLVSPRPVSKGRAGQRHAGASLPPKPLERGDAKPAAARARTPPPRPELASGEVRRLSISDSSVMTFADAAYSACNDEDCQEFLKQLVAKSRLPKSGHSAWQRDFQSYVRKDGAELFGKLRKAKTDFRERAARLETERHDQLLRAQQRLAAAEKEASAASAALGCRAAEATAARAEADAATRALEKERWEREQLADAYGLAKTERVHAETCLLYTSPSPRD